ncbi:MAG TPA: response regulator transcription factor [Anaerolineales bacterium]|nr:response regulator transcription factor [Anaerolineales bacterium]HRF46086.1 response regulator transcription factor [Anaerolineales bacterium]
MEKQIVLVIEDNAQWREMYAELLPEPAYELRFAASYAEGRGELQRGAFHLAIVDLNLASTEARQDNRDGYRLLQAAQQRRVPTIVVSGMDDPDEVDRAYEEHGVFAFVEKALFDRKAFQQLAEDAVRLGTTGPADQETPAQLQELTDREREVLLLMAQGYTNRQIGEALLITPNTVKKHVDHILQKLRVSNRAGAVSVALQAGMRPAARPGE